MSKLKKDDKLKMFNNIHKEIKLVLLRGPGAAKKPGEAIQVKAENLPNVELWHQGMIFSTRLQRSSDEKSSRWGTRSERNLTIQDSS